MSVVVHDAQIDLALRLLWREANKEGIIEKLEELKFYVPKTKKVHEIRKKFAKTKKRRRQAKRKLKQ